MEAQDVPKLWKECHETKISIVAKRNGMTRQALMGLFWEWSLLGNELDDPTPEAIAKETAALRSTWSEEQERSRWMGARTANPIGR